MKEETENAQNSQYTLLNTLNFHSNLTCSMKEILCKYVNLVVEYTSFISEKVNIKNKKYYGYLYDRGLETISHVFSMILYYTKNLDITYYHSQKAFYFYVEFIEQIIDIQHSFLQLSSRDASIFVYKKTVYEINNEYRKSIDAVSTKKDVKFELLNSYVQIFKLLIHTDMNQFKEIVEIMCGYDHTHSQLIRILQVIYLYADKMMDEPSVIDISVFTDLIMRIKKIIHDNKPFDHKMISKLKLLAMEEDMITEPMIESIFNK
jgi:hypothetical protein